ncbi:MAG: energy transducer TonB [Acidobacteria bacterium]|nr:energy transducer TonB [Acidobacteriota bacterium]MBV9144415.1 energy transducer TonB [Acidobacteriota bacterium]MBV9434982.1 energy transducer TonB [Acidobacteriota bacterium]
MTQRNNLHGADHPLHANAVTAGPGTGTLITAADTSTRVPATSRGRRGTRIAASLPIEVRDQFGGREETRTQFLMVRGAVLSTSTNVRVGHKLTIQNLKNGRIAECHVIAVEPVVKNVHQVEVEFTRPQPEFWPVQFPADEKLSESSTSSAFLTNGHGHAVEPALELETAKTHVGLDPQPVAMAEAKEELVVLADSVATFNPPEALHSGERYSSKTATLDSVAQFRAANRAAHRRQQHMKVFYTFLFLALAGGGYMEFRNWSQRTETSPSPASVVTASVQKPSPTQPSLPSRTTAEAQAAPAPQQQPAALDVQPDPSLGNPEAQPAASTPDASPQDTQVQVRHGATSSRLTQNPPEEEAPMALPLRAGDSTLGRPDVLNSVVAHIPAKNAVLAPQAPKKMVPAKILHSAAAQYPSVARQMRVEGTVLLDIEIDASGSVSDAKAVSGPPLLRAAALDAVRRWKYEPATLADKPIASTQSVKVDFRLH